MKIVFVAEIDTHTYSNGKEIKMTSRIETESPSDLLGAISRTNGTRIPLPSLETLLIHLFETKAAYADYNYKIFINVIGEE